MTVPDAPHCATGTNLSLGGTRLHASSQAPGPNSLIGVFKNLLLPASSQQDEVAEGPAAWCPDSAIDSGAEYGEQQQASIQSFRSASTARQIGAKVKQNVAEESVPLSAPHPSALSRQPARLLSRPDSQVSITDARVESGAGGDTRPKRLQTEGSIRVAQSSRCAEDGSSPTPEKPAGPAALEARVTTRQASFLPDNWHEQLPIALLAELTLRPLERLAGGLPHAGKQPTSVLRGSRTIALLSTQSGTADVVAQSTLRRGDGAAPRPDSQGFAGGRGVSANSFNGNWNQSTETVVNPTKAGSPSQPAESLGTARHLNRPQWSDSPAADSIWSRQVGGVASHPSVQNQSRGSASSSFAVALSPQPDSTAVAGHEHTLDWSVTPTQFSMKSGLGKESATGQLGAGQSPGSAASPSSSRREPLSPQPGSTGPVSQMESLAWSGSPTVRLAESGLGKESATGQLAAGQSPGSAASPSPSRREPPSPQPGSTGPVSQMESLAWSGSPTVRLAESELGKESATGRLAAGQHPSSAISLGAPRKDQSFSQPDSNDFASHQNCSDLGRNYATDSAERERESTFAQIRYAQARVNGALDQLKAQLVAPASLRTDPSSVVGPTDSLKFTGNPNKSAASTSHDRETELDNDDRREKVQAPRATSKPAGCEPMRMDQSGGIANAGTAQTTATAPILTKQNEVQTTSRPLTQAASSDGTPESTLSAQASRSSTPISSIDVQVQLQSDSQIGLRFFDRQGHVEVQMKSADRQVAQTLIEGLDGLKSSLTREGWSVESRVLTRLPLTADPTPEPSAFARGATLTSQSPSISLPRLAWVDGTPSVEDGHVHGPQDHTDSTQYVRTEPPVTAPLNHRGDADSSSGQGRAHPDQGGASGSNEQQRSPDPGSRDSEKQGRRAARNRETWMESIESLLSQPTSVRFSTGA